MKLNKSMLLMAMAGATIMSCTDKEYDLANIDSTIRVQMDELVVPVDLDDVTLKSVLDIENNEKIKNINGEYVIEVEGDFSSGEINIPTFTASGRKFDSQSANISKKVNSTTSAKARLAATRAGEEEVLAEYELSQDKITISTSKQAVDDAIQSLKGLDINTSTSLEIIVDKGNELGTMLDKVRIESLKLQFPAGVEGTAFVVNADGTKTEAGKCDSNTGVADFSNAEILANNGKIKIELQISRLTQKFLDEITKKVNNSLSFEFSMSYNVCDGYIAIHESDFNEDFLASLDDESEAKARRAISLDKLKKLVKKAVEKLPETLETTTTPVIEDVVIENLSGTLDYQVDNFSVKSMELADIPSILHETGTNIVLDNPQIYLKLNNPVEDKNGTLAAKTGLELTSVSPNGKEQTYTLANGAIVAGKKENVFCISPKAVDKYIEGYEGAENVQFADLSKILSGEGMPNIIKVQPKGTSIHEENVEEFKLGQNLGKVTGKYKFYAPLQLTENSTIVYTDSINGWMDEGGKMNNLMVEKLLINANVTSEMPMDMTIEIWPIDKNGKKLAKEGSSIVPAYAKDYSLTFDIKDKFSGLDGVVIKMNCVSKDAKKTLGPELKMKFNSFKPQVTGYYDTEL